MNDWMEIEIPKVNISKVKKKRKNSVYKDSKQGVHITINGLGKVSSLVKKNNKRR